MAKESAEAKEGGSSSPPSGRLSLTMLTYNVGTYAPPEDEESTRRLARILGLSEEEGRRPDVYAIGFQEVSSRLDRYLFESYVSGEDPWTTMTTDFFYEAGYIRAKRIRLLGIILNIYVRFEHLLHLRELETTFVRLSAGGWLGLKGAVVIRFKLYGVHVCIVNSHLSAHDHNLSLRVEEYNTIVESVRFRKTEVTNILTHDYVFWIGDLNFRIMEGMLTSEDILRLMSEDRLDDILQKDQLKHVKKEERAFGPLDETGPTFPPTYKFRVKESNYDAKRRPAWTDRILYRCSPDNYENFEPQLTQLSYTSHDFRSSDHRPVTSSFNVRYVTRSDRIYEFVPAYDPIITFETPAPWYIGLDGCVTYNVKQGESGYLGIWDWVALFKSHFRSLDDYMTFTWASSCRLTGVPKVSVFMNLLAQPGKCRLIYFGQDGCVLGMSNEFDVLPGPDEIPIEVAEEAVEEEH